MPFSALEKCRPAINIPAVCRHGDEDSDNFIVTAKGTVVGDFEEGRFEEPPSEPYGLISPKMLIKTANAILSVHTLCG